MACIRKNLPKYQKLYRTNIQFVEGFSNDLYDMTDAHDSSMVIFDNLMYQCSNDQRMVDLLIHGSHHRGITVLFLTQNLFPPGKLSWTLSLNMHYMSIF